MKNKMLSAIMVLFYGILCLSAAFCAEDANISAKDLSFQIGKEAGLTDSEQKSLHSSVKEMLEQGAGKNDIRSAVSAMAKKGIRGDDLNSSVESMKDLVKSGKNPKEAGNIVSQAAHQAKAEGLKGKDLANRVHEAINEMQAEKRQDRERELEKRPEPPIGGQRERRGHPSSTGAEGMGMGAGHGGRGAGHGRK